MSENNASLRLYLMLVHLIRGIPVLHRLTWRIRKNYNRAKRLLWVHRPVVNAAPLLHQVIMNGIPYAAGKMGSTECASLAVNFKREKAKSHGQKPVPYPPYLYHTLYLNSGVFPQNADFYDLFCQHYLQAVSACNMLVAWDVAGEAETLSRTCQTATLVRLSSLDPFFSPTPWTAALKNKRVLVISPFTQSIHKQYARHAELWDNPAMLPPFDLLTMAAPLSAGLVAPQDKDWFHALNRMKSEMDGYDYDVALIGAGAFSLPLAVHAKSRGKIGIHLGGALQMLFGIYGERYVKDEYYSPFIKENWVRPSAQETPPAYKKNEEGCYW